MPRFSRSERRGLVALTCALALCLSALTYKYAYAPQNDAASDSLAMPVAQQHTQRSSAPRYYKQPEAPRESFPFDPNTADSTQLLRLGLTPSMVRGIYRFRSMGYTYSSPESFARVPGMTQGLWDHLRPLIRIAPEFLPVELPAEEPRRQRTAEATPTPSEAPRDTVRYPIKLKQGEKIELNSADTTALKHIPGIGSYLARQIVRYRTKLGGYVSADQLDEIEGMSEGVEQYVRIDSSLIKRIQVNHATKNQLIAHPYLRLYRARAIWDYRHAYGPLPSANALLSLPDFSASDVARLLPYLDFSN